MTQIIFIGREGERQVYGFQPGDTVLTVARRFGIAIEGACDGAMACSTCHVIVDRAWYDRLPPPRLEERDMLDLAYRVKAHSRLGCQIVLTEGMDGLTVRLP